MRQSWAILPRLGLCAVALFAVGCGEEPSQSLSDRAADQEFRQVARSGENTPIVRYRQGRFSGMGQQAGVRAGRVAAATPEESAEAKRLAQQLRSRLGNRALEQEIRASAAALQTDAVIEVAKAMLESPNVETRAEAINLLAGSDHPGAAELLNQAFADADADVRQLAFQGAAVLPPEAFEAGLLAGLEDPELAVRQAAFQAATAMETPTAQKAVQRGIESPYSDITLNAMVHLEVGMQKAEVPLVIGALDHSQPEVRSLAKEILSTLTYQTFSSEPLARQWWKENHQHFDQDLVVNNPESYPAFNLIR